MLRCSISRATWGEAADDHEQRRPNDNLRRLGGGGGAVAAGQDWRGVDRFPETGWRSAVQRDLAPGARAWIDEDLGTTGSTRRSARCCSGTCCASAATRRSSTTRPAIRRSWCSPTTWSSTAASSSGRSTMPWCASSPRRARLSTRPSSRSWWSTRAPATAPASAASRRQSEVGVALRAGHPVYFVTFFPQPEPGQTIEDVGRAEVIFLRKVCELHPDAAASRW